MSLPVNLPTAAEKKIDAVIQADSFNRNLHTSQGQTFDFEGLVPTSSGSQPIKNKPLP